MEDRILVYAKMRNDSQATEEQIAKVVVAMASKETPPTTLQLGDLVQNMIYNGLTFASRIDLETLNELIKSGIVTKVNIEV